MARRRARPRGLRRRCTIRRAASIFPNRASTPPIPRPGVTRRRRAGCSRCRSRATGSIIQPPRARRIWSVAIGADGSFGDDARLEIDLESAAADTTIASIAFDQDGAIYLAQRGAQRGDFAYKSFAAPKTSAVLRFQPAPDGKWAPAPQEYAIGFSPDYRNADGGVALGYAYDPTGKLQAGACGGFVWSTGELLRQGGGLPGLENLHGLQGMTRDRVRPANQPPRQSYFVAFDPKVDDEDAAGHTGAVVAFQPCEAQPGAPSPQLNILPAPQPGILPAPQPEILPAPPPDMEPIPELVPPPDFPPPPGQPASNLKITKTGGNCTPKGNAGDFDCAYTITVLNVGGAVFTGPLQVDDTNGASSAPRNSDRRGLAHSTTRPRHLTAL